jgi:hypothetical protein
VDAEAAVQGVRERLEPTDMLIVEHPGSLKCIRLFNKSRPTLFEGRGPSEISTATHRIRYGRHRSADGLVVPIKCAQQLACGLSYLISVSLLMNFALLCAEVRPQPQGLVR